MDYVKNRFERIQKPVEKILKAHGVVKPPVPVERIALARGTQLRYVPYEGEMSGMIAREDGVVVIGVNALHPKTRQRFTIGHELGHLELGHLDALYESGLHVDRNFRNFRTMPRREMRRDEVSSQAVDIAEIEANAFAAELLMPTEIIERDLRKNGVDPDDDELILSLAKKYQVSVQAMTFRLAKLTENLMLKS
jgi:Zn-dependent peptidase ImmA (M78 family)